MVFLKKHTQGAVPPARPRKRLSGRTAPFSGFALTAKNAVLSFYRAFLKGSITHGFHRIGNFSGYCRYFRNLRLDSGYRHRSGRERGLQGFPKVRWQVIRNKLTASALIGALAVTTSLAPGMATAATIQTAKVGAVYYPMTGGVVGAAVAIGGLLTKANPWINAITVGYAMYKFALGQDGGAMVNVRPSGVAEYVPAWNGTTPPSTSASTTVYGTITNHSAQVANIDTALSQGCAAQTNVGGYNLPGHYVINGAGTSYFAYCKTSSGAEIGIDSAVPITKACSAGYTLSGSTCNLSNASAVPYPSDGVPTVVPKTDGTGTAADPRDPDTLPPGFDQTKPSYTDGAGGKTEVSPNTGGGYTVNTYNTYNYGGDTYTYNQTMTVDSAGKVTDSYAGTKPGTPTTTPSASTQPQTTVDTSALAKTADITAVKDAITTENAKVDAQRDKENADADQANIDIQNKKLVEAGQWTAEGLALPGQDKFNVADTSGIADKMPATGGTCVTMPVSIVGFASMDINPCPVVDAVHPMIDWGLRIMGLLSGLFILLRPEA